MPRWKAIVRTTALEMLSEPLSLLVLLAALAIAVLAPAFHYHQFGEATRMARDAGLSALFTCGTVFAVFPTIRAFRREVESGTLEMALAHPVSRAGFFLAKTLGAFVAYIAFFVVVSSTALVIVVGAAIGGTLAQKSGDVARLYGPCFAAGMAVVVLPLLVGAALHRFAHCRFVLSAFMSALALSAVAAACFFNLEVAVWLSPVAVLVALAASVPLAAAAAFSVRLRANAAAAASGGAFAAMLPVIGNYCLFDALSHGGSVSWGYVGLAALVTAPAVAFFILLGVGFSRERDAA